MASKALAPVKAARPKATAAKRSPVVVDAATTIYDIPSSELVADALNSHSKLYFDGDVSGDSFLADTIAGAESGADLFAESELGKVEDHLGETLIINAVEAVRNSEFEGGIGVYLIVEALTLDGEAIKLAVGQSDPLAKIVKLHELGELPWPVAFERSKKATKAGFYPINLLSRKQKDGSTF